MSLQSEVVRKSAISATLLPLTGYSACAIGLLWAIHNWLFVIDHYIRVPFMDQWSWLDRYYRNGLWRTMLMQQNEHRLFFPSLAYALDQHLGRGLNLLLILMLLCAQSLTFFIAWLPFRRAREFPRGMAAFLGGATAVFATWFLQAEDLFWAFQFHMVLAACLSIASFYCMAKGLVEHRGRYHAGSIAAAFVATFSFAYGMFTWPLLIAICFLKGPRFVSIAYGAGFALTLALYLHGYHSVVNADPITSLEHNPVSVVYYLLVYMGRPFIPESFADFSQGSATTAAIFGLAGLLLCTGITVYYVARQKQDFEQHFYVPVMLWTVATGFVTALGRINMPLSEVLGSRYVVVQILFWYTLIAISLSIAMRRRLFWPLLQGEIIALVALLCVLTYPSHRTYGDGYANAAQVLSQQASAAYVGVFDASQWTQGDVVNAAAPNVLEALRRTHRGPFAFPEAAIVGMNINSFRQETGCQGNLDQISFTSDHHGVRIVGWAWGANQQQVATVALADVSGKILGWAGSGVPRPDVVRVFHDAARANSGWVGYASLGAVRAFALSNDRRGACVLTGGGDK